MKKTAISEDINRQNSFIKFKCIVPLELLRVSYPIKSFVSTIWIDGKGGDNFVLRQTIDSITRNITTMVKDINAIECVAVAN